MGISPSITSYSPGSGPAGTLITINGTGFGPTRGSGSVILQSVTNIYTGLTVVSWIDAQVTVSVPKLTPTCLSYFSITVDGLQSIGTYPFQVTSQ
ncbi:MAG: IPT/TIG domain-containing protein [Candidatus Acidiferrum sp.]